MVLSRSRVEIGNACSAFAVVLCMNTLSLNRDGGWGQASMVWSMVRFAEGLLVLLLIMAVWLRQGLFDIARARYVQAVFVLLLLMSACSVGVAAERVLRFTAARHQSRSFMRQVAEALQNHDLDQAISIAGHFKRSPAAKVAASGLANFQAAMPLLPDADVIETAQRALRRSAALVHGELRRGLHILASISSTGPLVGAFGTLVGIMDAFQGCAGARSFCMALTADGLAKALLPTALALLIAAPTLWCYKFLHSKLEAFDLEMENESLELANWLTIYLGQRS